VNGTEFIAGAIIGATVAVVAFIPTGLVTSMPIQTQPDPTRIGHCKRGSGELVTAQWHPGGGWTYSCEKPFDAAE
jgi:hypothetical protein